MPTTEQQIKGVVIRAKWNGWGRIWKLKSVASDTAARHLTKFGSIKKERKKEEQNALKREKD
jgi:hypothetical protein